MKHAGQALHKAKANGKNQVQIFTEALHAEANYKLFVENNLRRALLQNELEVFYQPSCACTPVGCRGWRRCCAGTTRKRHDPAGPVHQRRGRDRVDHSDRQMGRSRSLPHGRYAVGTGSGQTPDRHQPVTQAVLRPGPAELHRGNFAGGKLPAGQLELELTESLLLDATEETRQQLIGLKALGLTLAMDDFGTGYSSLSYLKKFPIDVIKIDRSFIKDIPDNQDDVEITSAVIAMARKLHLKVVAEGIETPEQLKFLRRHRCDIGQGYLFDKPIRAPD